MSFDGITFRELVPCVPWRRITEVPSFWREVCSSLAGTAKSMLAWEGGGHSSSPPVRAQDGPRLSPAVEKPQGFH